MEALVTHTGTAAPLRKSDIDTDQIIPVRFVVSRVTKKGWGEGMMADLRAESEFVLNQPQYAESSILVAGENFGTGSSREWAVWALMDYGFRVVFSTKFGDIFRNNAATNGLVAATLPPDAIEQLWKQIENYPEEPFTVDLQNLEVSVGGLHFEFEFPEDFRWRVLNGIDEIDLTLQSLDQIEEYEAGIRPSKPKVPRSSDAYKPTPVTVDSGE